MVQPNSKVLPRHIAHRQFGYISTKHKVQAQSTGTKHNVQRTMHNAKAELTRHMPYSLHDIYATNIGIDLYTTATDLLCDIYATMNFWLVANESLTVMLHIYALTFTLQYAELNI